MSALGIFLNDIVEIIANNYYGSVIIGKRTLRVGIGWKIASKILVEKVES